MVKGLVFYMTQLSQLSCLAVVVTSLINNARISAAGYHLYGAMLGTLYNNTSQRL